MSKTASKKGWLENAFQGSFWDTKIKSANVRPKEMWLGYVAGPFGVMLLYSVVNSYYNQYLTDVMGFTAAKGAWIAGFMVAFPVVSKLLDAVTNVIMTRILDTTTCKQGKLRPWMIMSLPVIIVSVIMLFSVPEMDPIFQAIWVLISFNLFYSVGYTIWNMAYQLSAPLSTRNIQQRKNNAMAGQIVKNVGVGMISIIFPSIMTAVGSMMEDNYKQSYLVCMCLVCCVTVPLTFIQYFFTRERVTEERRKYYNAVSEDKTAKIKEASLMEQFKACLKSRYWIILVVVVLVYQVLNNIRDMSLIYYSGWVVSGNAYGEYAAIQAKFQMIAMSPMGPGLVMLLPLIKKYGRRNCIWVGSIFTMIGAATAFFNQGNAILIYAGTAVMSIGNLAFAYTFLSFIGDCIDHVEWKTGVRTEGATGGLVGFATCISAGLGQGIFNLGLMLTGYMAPEKIGETVEGIALYADQPVAAVDWINMAYQGSHLIIGIMAFVAFRFFFDLENKLPEISKDLQQKKIEECEAMGVEYIPPYELERREQEELRRVAEENRVKELKEYCQKRNLDFDKENQKYLDKVAAKEAKKAAKKAKKEAKKAKK
ncbi:MAG: MFS transporter [Agathobacter sp.]|nr:MFS transporter [Agathobacter sp.]